MAGSRIPPWLEGAEHVLRWLQVLLVPLLGIQVSIVHAIHTIDTRLVALETVHKSSEYDIGRWESRFQSLNKVDSQIDVVNERLRRIEMDINELKRAEDRRSIRENANKE